MNYIIISRNESMKKLSAIFTAVLLSAALSACAEKKSFTEPDGKLDSCSIRFSWWGGDDRHEATLKAIDLWNDVFGGKQIL